MLPIGDGHSGHGQPGTPSSIFDPSHAGSSVLGVMSKPLSEGVLSNDVKQSDQVDPMVRLLGCQVLSKHPVT